ncbi:MAG: hypothetical protein PHG48_03960 [Eubacteriales bacterium]|nr:hypothetical protein [Eubacteriales bacterium]
MLQITGFMLGMAMFLLLCAVLIIIILFFLIRRLYINISQRVRDKKYPLKTVNASIFEKFKDENNGAFKMTFRSEDGEDVTVGVSSWEYSMLDIGQKVIFSYRNNIAVEIKPVVVTTNY